MKKLFTILAVVMVCIFLFVGCKATPTTSVAPSTSAAPTTAKPTTAAPAPTSTAAPAPTSTAAPAPNKYGGTLKILYAHTPVNLGAPWQSQVLYDNQLDKFAVENLVTMDATGKIIPQLAASWEVSADKKTLTFTLRQGVKFHDGTDFNASAAKWNLEMYRDLNPSGKAALGGVTFDIVDPYTLRFNIPTWDPLFIHNSIFSAGNKMVSPTAAQKLIDAGKQDDAKFKPVGTGPFILDSYQPNVALKFKRNPDYWQKGLPYLDGVEVSFVADPVVAVAAFTKGEGHIIYEISVNDANSLKASGNTIINLKQAIFGIQGDSKNAGSPWADINVRRAVAYALDAKTIVNAVYKGFSPPTNQFAFPGLVGYDESIKGYPYDVAKAKELLATAGYSTSKPLKTKLPYIADPSSTELFALVQASLAKVGIDTELQPLDFPSWRSMSGSGWNNHFFMLDMGYNGLEMEYSVTLRNFMSATATLNKSCWTPDNYNQMLQEVLKENDIAKRFESYKQLNKILVDDYCVAVPMWGKVVLTAYSPKVQDCNFGDGKLNTHHPANFWLSK